MKSLIGTYFHYNSENIEYVVNHELVMEGMARTLWENMGFREYFIRICPERFLIRLSSNTSAAFYIPAHHYAVLFERVYALLESKVESSYMIIANIALWENEDATSAFKRYISNNDSRCIDNKGTSLLVHAAMQGRLNLVQSLLDDESVDTKQLCLALCKACEGCHLDVVNFLLSRKSPVVDIDLLFHAIKGKSVEIFQAVSAEAGRIDFSTKQDSMTCMFFTGYDKILVTLIEEIVLSGNLKLLKHVLESEHLNSCDMLSENPRIVEFAAFSGSVELMQFILAVTSVVCPHLLWWASCSGSMDMITFLLNKGYNFSQHKYVTCDDHIKHVENLQDQNEMHGACLRGSIDIVKYIVETNPEFLQTRGTSGCTPALLSPFSGSLEIVKYMEEKSNLNSVSDEGYNILHFAAWQGQLDIVRYLAERYPSLLYTKNNQNEYPIYFSVVTDAIDVVEYMISKKCDILNQNSKGNTILHMACDVRNLTLVKYLVGNYPALLTMRDIEGQTPLHHAGLSGSVELVNYLVHQQHCDVLDKDSYGRTILHTACNGSEQKVVKYLVENYPALLMIRDNKEQTPLHHAGWSGSVEHADYLVSEQCDVFDQDSDGRTILHIACGEGKLSLVKHLVEKYHFLLAVRDNEGQTPLHRAGWSDSVELLDYLISQQCDVLYRDSDGRTILHNACQGGKLTLVKHLVEKYPALLTMRDNKGWTPLHKAGWFDSVVLADYLITQQCDVLDKDTCGRTILHIACAEGNLSLVKHLDENYSILLTTRDINALTPLHYAGWSDSMELVNYLISKHCDVFDRDSDGRTILHIACGENKLTLAKHLVEKYPVLLTMRDNDGQTPLHTAGWSDSVELVDYLISKQCDAIDTDSSGRTILHNACRGGKLTIVKHLVENYPALLRIRDIEGWTPLNLAGWSDSVELVDYLIIQQCNVFDKDNCGRTILHIVCAEGKLTLVKYLVQNYPALLTSRDNQDKTPLHTAGWSDSVDLVEYLISQQCDVFDKDSGGRTILHIACGDSKQTLVKHLVETYAALLTSRDNQGKTPFHTAGWSDSVDLVEYLISQQCDVLDNDNGGRTILHNACEGGKLTLVKHLVKKYPTLLTMTDNERQTPLHRAVFSDSIELVEYLIGQQCDVFDKEQDGMTILHNACLGRSVVIVKYLVQNYPALLTIIDNFGRKPLHVAGWSNSAELLDYLIGQHCYVHDRDNEGRTILHYACVGGKVTLVKHLLENYPDLLKINDNFGRTPLHDAGWSDSVELVGYLVCQYFDVRVRDNEGSTILHHACKGGKLTLVKHLVENYPALLTIRDAMGKTPLHHAGCSESVELVDYLVSKHCDVLYKDNEGKNILHHLCYKSNMVLVKHLVENYHSPTLLTIKDNRGMTSLLYAGCSGNTDLVDYLIGKGCEILDKEQKGSTILHIASYQGKRNLVKHLVENYPVLLPLRDFNEWTPLHVAAMSGSVDVVEYILSQTHDILDRTGNGSTVLHISCKGGKMALTKHLIERHPVLLTKIDNDWRTPLHVACAYSSVTVVEYLLSCGLKLATRDKRGRTALDMARLKGNSDIIAHLEKKYPGRNGMKNKNKSSCNMM